MPRGRDKYVIEMVTDRLSMADDARDEYTSRAVDNEELYHNYIDETDNPYLSNISVPWPYVIVESYLGKSLQMLASTMPYVRVVEEDDDSRKAAKAVERDANMVLYKQKWPVFAYNAYKQVFKYGTAFVMERPWEFYKGEEMPVFSLMNFFHVWVNPTVLTLDDLDAYVIYETYLPQAYLKQFADNPNYRNLGKVDVYEGELESAEEKEIRGFKNIPETRGDRYSNLVQVWYYWSHEDFCILTNGTNVIRDDRENYLGRIPVRLWKCIPLENELYGMSILEEGKDLFAECNENRNQMNDSAWLMLNPQYVVNRGANLGKTNIVAKPGGILWTDLTEGIVPLKQDWQLLNQGQVRQQSIYQDIQNYSNAFPQMRGQPATGAETATEFMGMRSAGELRSDTYNLLLSMMSVEQLVEDIVEFKKMHMTQPSSSYYWPEGKVATATPEDYEGNFSFKAYAGFKASKEIERKQFIEALTFIFGNQAFLPQVLPKVDEWLDRLLDYFDMRSPEQLRLSQEEQMAAKQTQMMQQMMLPFMQGGAGGQTPALGEREMRMPEALPNSPMGPMIGGMSG